MTTKSRGRGGKILDQIAEELSAKVKALSDDDLALLDKARKRVTTTNCWFGRYHAALAIDPFINEELRERPIRRAQAKRRECQNSGALYCEVHPDAVGKHPAKGEGV